MTTCIKCGQPIPDGELFCESCGLNGEVPQPRPALRPVGRMQTPVKREPRPGKPQPAPAPEKKSRGGRAAAAVLALLCALLLAGGAFGYVTLDGKLQEKQAEIDLENTTLVVRPLPANSSEYINEMGAEFQKYVSDEISFDDYISKMQECMKTYFPDEVK